MANGALEAYSESRSLNRVQMFAWGFVWIALSSMSWTGSSWPCQPRTYRKNSGFPCRAWEYC